MNKVVLVIGLFLLWKISVSAQEIRMSEIATLEQVYGETQEAQAPMSMNELGIDFGYVLYETRISVNTESVQLEVENVRDYAAVYLDGKLLGRLTDENKKMMFQTTSGEHTLKLYAENIGRITYGPEILDNSKGLFGVVSLNGTTIENWKSIPLAVKDCEVDKLQFDPWKENTVPCFYKGAFQIQAPQNIHLDLTGWGMGEVWVNGQYVGSFWEESTQLSVPLPASVQKEGVNHIVIFELKNNGKQTVHLCNNPIFK